MNGQRFGKTNEKHEEDNNVDDLKQQIEYLKSQGASKAIINDVIRSDYEAYPGNLENQTDDQHAMSAFEENIVAHTTDAKTWNSVKGSNDRIRKKRK
jgi:hypothetical protein